MIVDNAHIPHIKHALHLAHGQLGRVAPNPAVGAIVVKNGKILGVGVTASSGRPHAETIALAMAGSDAKKATLYVTLEPCAHHGKTPPCVENIIRSGVSMVAIATRDPDPRTNGRGIEMLKAAGIEVIEGICEQEAIDLNHGFLSLINRGRPFVRLKIASSSDGKMTFADGKSKWITNEKAREYGHYLRATHDAILTGTGTFLADKPQLTCRLPGLEEDSPKRFVLGNRAVHADGFTQLPRKNTIRETLETLGNEGITRLLVEAGPTLTSAFINEKMADEIVWFKAPMDIGADGKNALDALAMDQLNHYVLKETRQFGDNHMQRLCLQDSSPPSEK